MVKRRKDQKLRLRNFDARHGRIETGAEIKNRKQKCGVEGGKGICYQWKEKGQCSQGDQCSFWHESNDSAQNTLPPRLPRQLLHEAEVCRGREVSEAEVTMGPFFESRADYLKGTCTPTSCEYWHPPECQFFFFLKKNGL